MRRFTRQHQPLDLKWTHCAGDKHTRPHREHGGSSSNNRSVRSLSALSAGHNGPTGGRAQKASGGFVWRPESPCSHQIAARVAERDLETANTRFHPETSSATAVQIGLFWRPNHAVEIPRIVPGVLRREKSMYYRLFCSKL